MDSYFTIIMNFEMLTSLNVFIIVTLISEENFGMWILDAQLKNREICFWQMLNCLKAVQLVKIEGLLGSFLVVDVGPSYIFIYIHT